MLTGLVSMPPALGDGYDVNTYFVLIDGGTPNGWSRGTMNADGFRTVACAGPLDLVQRITLSVTHYDEAAVFNNVSLYSGVRTTISAVPQ